MLLSVRSYYTLRNAQLHHNQRHLTSQPLNMPFLDLPSEMRLGVYNAVLQPLLATPEHYDTYVLPEEWPQKSFADYHSLLLTNTQISGEVQHLFLSDYVDKVTVFFDNCPELYGFAEKLCVYAEQGKRLQDLRLSLRSPARELASLPLKMLWQNAYPQLFWSWSNAMRNMTLPTAVPNPNPVQLRSQHHTDRHRGKATICVSTCQSDDPRAVLHWRSVAGLGNLLDFSEYAEVRTTFAELSWVHWVFGQDARRPREHVRITEEGAKVIEKVREMVESPDTVQGEGQEVVEEA